MRVTRTSYMAWQQERAGTFQHSSLLPSTMCYWRKESKTLPIEQAPPPIQEPNKGVYFNAYA